MFTHPLVSIITPCYNSIHFLEECIESVLAQDWPCVEHVIQDGDSTDGTKKVLEKYAKTYPEKIKVVSEQDRGQSDGLNRALQRSKGDILLVLNADDALLPHACSWAVENMRKYTNAAVVYGDVYLIDKKSEVLDIYIAPHPYDFKELLCAELTIPAQAAFMRRSRIEKVGFYADPNLDSCPDYEMFVRIGLRFPMQYVPGVVSKYRKEHSELDSKKPRTTERMFRVKKLVMDKVFDSPEVPEHIKRLRKRAYAGLYIWRAGAAWGIGEKKVAWHYFLMGIGKYVLLGEIERAMYVIWQSIKRLRKEREILKKQK